MCKCVECVLKNEMEGGGDDAISPAYNILDCVMGGGGGTKTESLFIPPESLLFWTVLIMGMVKRHNTSPDPTR